MCGGGVVSVCVRVCKVCVRCVYSLLSLSASFLIVFPTHTFPLHPWCPHCCLAHHLRSCRCVRCGKRASSRTRRCSTSPPPSAGPCRYHRRWERSHPSLPRYEEVLLVNHITKVVPVAVGAHRRAHRTQQASAKDELPFSLSGYFPASCSVWQSYRLLKTASKKAPTLDLSVMGRPLA